MWTKVEVGGETMAKVICNMKCKHRSKKPLRTYKYRSGEKCYGCTLDAISVSRIFDPDDYVVEVVEEKNMAQCSCYEPIEEG